jgi:hypothetical protein
MISRNQAEEEQEQTEETEISPRFDASCRPTRRATLQRMRPSAGTRLLSPGWNGPLARSVGLPARQPCAPRLHSMVSGARAFDSAASCRRERPGWTFHPDPLHGHGQVCGRSATSPRSEFFQSGHPLHRANRSAGWGAAADEPAREDARPTHAQAESPPSLRRA